MRPSLPHLANVVPAAEQALAAALASLTQDLDPIPARGSWADWVNQAEVRNAAIDLIEQALAELARIKTPARRDHGEGPKASAVTTTGGPGSFAMPAPSGAPLASTEGLPWPQTPPPPPPHPQPSGFPLGVGPLYDALPRNWLLT
jgi:hypothetical protein